MNTQTRTASETASAAFHIFTIALSGLFTLGALIQVATQLV
jgi:hypothetical protein